MNKPELATIQCAICGKAVDRAEEHWNPTTDEFTYSVFCHGDSESMTLSRAWLQNGQRLGSGVAFSIARLPATSH